MLSNIKIACARWRRKHGFWHMLWLGVRYNSTTLMVESWAAGRHKPTRLRSVLIMFTTGDVGINKSWTEDEKESPKNQERTTPSRRLAAPFSLAKTLVKSSFLPRCVSSAVDGAKIPEAIVQSHFGRHARDAFVFANVCERDVFKGIVLSLRPVGDVSLNFETSSRGVPHGFGGLEPVCERVNQSVTGSRV